MADFAPMPLLQLHTVYGVMRHWLL